jgi:uncharacterized membrane protein YoaK (UPF0700 family)
MNPMQNETVLLEGVGNGLILSTHRVRYETEAMGTAEIKSIMLEQLASCAMVRSSNVILLILAAVSLVLGIVVAASGPRNEGALIIGVIGSLVLAGLYFASRRQVLSLASAGTTITVNLQGMKPDAVKEFIEKTEAAKNSRYLMGVRI